MDGISGSLLDLLTYYDSEFTKLRALLEDKKILWITYEDGLLAGPVNAYKAIETELTLAPFIPRLRYGRTNPEPLRELILNFKELQDALLATDYEWMTKLD